MGTTPEEIHEPQYTIEYLLPTIDRYLSERVGQPIPLIVAGGIWNCADIERMLGLGASGVQIGTRFITTVECDADIRYKEFHLNASAEDIAIIPSPVGKPGRAICNAFAEAAIAGSPQLEKRCVTNCLQSCLCRDRQETSCLLQALANAASGNIENGSIFSGDKAGRADRIVSVSELMIELTTSQKTLAVGNVR